MRDTNRPTPAMPENPGLNSTAIGELRAALLEEAKLVRELRDALTEQRNAVATGKPEEVNAGTDAISRILISLDDARNRRARLLASGTGQGPLPLDQIERRLGTDLPEALASARDSLRRAVAEVAFEVDINRTVLRHAVKNGEAFLQALFASASSPDPSYSSGSAKGGPQAGGSSRGGVILDRKV